MCINGPYYRPIYAKTQWFSLLQAGLIIQSNIDEDIKRPSSWLRENELIRNLKRGKAVAMLFGITKSHHYSLILMDNLLTDLHAFSRARLLLLPVLNRSLRMLSVPVVMG